MRIAGGYRRLGSALLAVVVGTAAADAGVIAVNETTCTLIDAITAANTDSAVGGCSAGSGEDAIVLGANVALTAPLTAASEGGQSGLPAIVSSMSISAAAGTIIERSSTLDCDEASTPFRLLEVSSPGVLTLSGLSLRNGCVAGGNFETWSSGGAVLVRSGGELRVSDCHFEGNSARGVNFTSLSGLARGGAIAVLGGKLQVTESSFTENEVIGAEPHGGAVTVEAGELLELMTSRFVSNHAGRNPFSAHPAGTSSGGAISLREATTGTLAHLVISDNTLGVGGDASGGGLEIAGGRVRELRDSVFSGNVAQAGSTGPPTGTSGRGGGLANSGEIDSIVRTTFTSNQALGHYTGDGRGGGLDNTGRIGRIVSSTFVGNVAQVGIGELSVQARSIGGGVANVGSIGWIEASTFVGNECQDLSFTSYSAGGGIFNGLEGSAIASGVTIRNSLLAENIAMNGPDCLATAAFASDGFNLAQAPDASCVFTSAGDIVGADPQAMPLGDNGCSVDLPGGSCMPTVAIPQTSPAVDAGRCDGPGSEIDARGAVRPLDEAGVPNAAGGDGCDIGAFEFDAALAAVHVGLSVADSAERVISGSGAGNLTYTIALASLGTQAATGIVVTPALPLPAGVVLDSATPSVGSWNGSAWTIASLASGEDATLALAFTVGIGAPCGTDALTLAAAVTAATSHSGELAADAESTTVLEGIFVDGFESGDTAAWSLTIGG